MYRQPNLKNICRLKANTADNRYRPIDTNDGNVTVIRQDSAMTTAALARGNPTRLCSQGERNGFQHLTLA